ncbi:MAG: hypothetical protein ACREJU_17865 [Nitrospiraceae bacterium]
MRCPKCAGLLTLEDIHEHSGRFRGWRCIQCGLRLDQTIVENRHAAVPHPDSSGSGDSAVCVSERPVRTSNRSKRSAARR